MSKTIKTNYIHALGQVVVSTGIGDSVYYPMVRKTNGSLKRILRSIDGNANPDLILEQIEKSNSKTICKAEGCRDRDR